MFMQTGSAFYEQYKRNEKKNVNKKNFNNVNHGAGWMQRVKILSILNKTSHWIKKKTTKKLSWKLIFSLIVGQIKEIYSKKQRTTTNSSKMKNAFIFSKKKQKKKLWSVRKTWADIKHFYFIFSKCVYTIFMNRQAQRKNGKHLYELVLYQDPNKKEKKEKQSNAWLFTFAPQLIT